MTIAFELSPKSIEGAIHRVELYSKDLQKKAEIFVDKLAEDVKYNAEKELINHVYTGETFDSLRIDKLDKVGVYTRNILVGGAAVWLEFGTGVVANNCSPGDFVHQMPGVYFKIKGIGTYGKGHGADPNGWYYPDEAGEWHHTYGIPATMFMWRSAQTTRAKIPEMARRFFHT
jgi:hypothetical protein